jgi:replication factor C subunit 3/5
MTEPWVEKYRPSNLSEVISQDNVIATIKEYVKDKNIPHMLLHGSSGSGKTSTILAVAKEIYEKQFFNMMVLELNASDDRGIDIVRNRIKKFVETKIHFSKNIKLIILDEADNMTPDAQNALRRIIELYYKNARFCIICNYVNKIIPALQSRCTNFKFDPLRPIHMKSMINKIVKEEKLTISEGGLDKIINMGNGDMRTIINLLQVASYSNGCIDEDNLYKLSGKPTREIVIKTLDIINNNSFKESLSLFLELKEKNNLFFLSILSELSELVIEKQYKNFDKIIEIISEIEHNVSYDEGIEEVHIARFIALLKTI